MEWLLDDLKDTNLIDEVIIVSNHKFYNLFMEWKNKINNKYNNEYTIYWMMVLQIMKID